MAEYNINDQHENTNDNGDNTINDIEKAADNQYNAPAKHDAQSAPDASYEQAPKNDEGYTSYQSTPYNGTYGAQFRQPYATPYYRPNYDTGAGASYTFSNDPSFGAENTNNTKKKKKKSGALKIAAILLCVILLAGATGVGGAFFAYNMLLINDNADKLDLNNGASADENETNSPADEHRAPVNINKVEGSTTQNTTMTDVIAAVRDTVVEIVTENIQESQFYGQYVTSGAGSGVIINENGYIITNNHVVEGANTIYVRTTDEKEYKATLIGTDQESDVAVIKIDASGLSAATLGDSSAIKLGEDVIAIGNPLGSLGGTVTNGIISALDREVNIDGQEMVLLQTNAAVNPGNSGGGLFNMAGELIGVVNAKSSSSSSGTTIEGLGFAIPVNHAFDVASQLIEYGYVKGKVSLGITVNVYEKDMVYKQGFTYYTIKAGVYVDDPGKNTELKKDDRFVSIDGITVSSMADIKAILAEHKVGDTIKATVARAENNKEVQVEVTLTCFEYVPQN